MGSITVRRLDDDVKAALRLRAARAGRSLEAEARLILSAAARQPKGKASGSLYDLADELFPQELRLEGGLNCSGADKIAVVAPDLP